MVGTIMKISERGFLFIRPDGTTDSLFAHCHEMDGAFDALSIGQRVEFEVDGNHHRGDQRPRAVRVRVVE